MTGWTDYSFSGDNVAAHQRGLKMVPPMLQVPDGPGRWRTVIGEIGFPVGRPQTVPVDLTGVISRDATVVRIVTTMRVYWDQIVVSTTDESVKPVMTRLEPVSADLRWRGFSAEVTPDGREPFVYDYERVSGESPWKVLPGRYTRLGDVRDLLHKTDDFFVVARPGDEVALSFDATALRAAARRLDADLPALRFRLQQGDGPELVEPGRPGAAAVRRDEGLPVRARRRPAPHHRAPALYRPIPDPHRRAPAAAD